MAAASFYHYFRSYAFAAGRQASPKRFWIEVIGVNLGVIGLGVGMTRWGGLLAFFFSPAFFTFWVGVHLLASDWHRPLLRRFQKEQRPASALSHRG